MQRNKPFSAKSFFLLPLVGLAVSAVGIHVSNFCDAGDWTSWRGPTQDGVSLEKELPTSAKEFVCLGACPWAAIPPWPFTKAASSV